MKDFTAYGIVVSGKLCAVYLEKYFAGRDLMYHQHKGRAIVVELQVTKESLEFINKTLEEEQNREEKNES